MVDWEHESVLPLRDIDNILPGGRVSESTKFRWATKGVRRVRLATFLKGGRRMTSLESVRRFFAEISAMHDAMEGVPGEPVCEEAASRRQQEVDAELLRRGC